LATFFNTKTKKSLILARKNQNWNAGEYGNPSWKSHFRTVLVLKNRRKSSPVSIVSTEKARIHTSVLPVFKSSEKDSRFLFTFFFGKSQVETTVF